MSPFNPFAIAESDTYYLDDRDNVKWFAPLTDPVTGAPQRDENGQQQYQVREFTDMVDVGDTDPHDVWVRLRIPTSRADIAALTSLEDNVEIERADQPGVIERKSRNMEARRDSFVLLAEGWSFGPDRPTAQDYGRLQPPVAAWVDACVFHAVGRGLGAYQKKGPSKSPRSTSRKSSAAATRSTKTV